MVNVAAINVLAELGTATWPTPQSVAYEAALEGVSQAIAFYSELIGQEESTTEQNLVAIDGWRAQQRAWAVRGRELSPLDVKAIESVYDDAEELLSEKDDSDEDDAPGDYADDDADDDDHLDEHRG